MKEETFPVTTAPYTDVTTPYTVAIDDTADVIRAARAIRAVLIVKNMGPDPVALGPPGITFADAPLYLEVGESVELPGFTGALSGITSAPGETATVRVWDGTLKAL